MKEIQTYKTSLVFILMTMITSSISAKSLGEKREIIEKSFPVTASTELDISNQFGEVHVDTWNKNELKVSIEIIVNGKTDDRAQKMLDKLKVDIEEGSEISFITRISGNTNSKDGENFEINYKVSYPSGNRLSIDNRFGDTYVASRSGATDLEISYGNLKTEDLTGFLNLDLSFGNGNVGSTKESEIDVKYSDLEITSGEVMEMEQQFSNVKIAKVGKLDLESKYGDVKIGEVDEINVDAEFSGFTIEKLNDQLFMEASYVSKFSIDELSKTFTSVKIYGKYSTYTIRLQEGLKADLEAEFSFANMITSNGQIDVYYKVKDDNRSEYKARIGGGDPNRKISVKSSYGDLRVK